MKDLVLSDKILDQEVLITYKGHNFRLKSCQSGQYGFERRVQLHVIKENLKLIPFKNVAIFRLFSNDNIIKESEATQCLIIGETTFDKCLEAAKDYIRKYIDFISK